MKDIFHQFDLYRQIVSAFQSVLEVNYGYKRILLNTLEREETFSRTLGISSDIVQKEMYSFTDKSGHKLVLRPEGTAGTMRFVMNDEVLMRNIEKTPAKMWYWGPMFRYERP